MFKPSALLTFAAAFIVLVFLSGPAMSQVHKAENSYAHLTNLTSITQSIDYPTASLGD